MNAARVIFAAVLISCAAIAPFGVSWTAAAGLAKPWTEQECLTVGGVWSNNDCYAKQTPVKLSVSIGGLSQATLSQYLGAAFNLGVGIAATLAVIFIMIGGFRYLYAAGGSEVDAAKGMIRNAVIGLVLTALSFTLLQTVNPALVSLELPPIKLVRSVYLDQLSSAAGNITVGGPCYTIQDKAACAQACVTRGLTDTSCECTVVDPGLWSKFATAATWISVGAVGGEIGAYKLAGEGLKDVGASGLNVASRLWKYVKVNPFTVASGAVTAGKVMSTPLLLAAAGYAVLPTAPEKGDEGVCLPLALATIPPGGTCFEDKNCAQGKCSIINKNPPYGMCVSGAEGTACSEDSPTFMINNEPWPCATKELSCCVVNYGLGTCQKNCAKRALGVNCTTDDQCESGECAMTADSQSTVCVASAANVFCTSNADCDNVSAGWYCPFASMEVGSSVDRTSDTFKTLQKCRPKENAEASCCLSTDCLSGPCSAVDRCYMKVVNGQYTIDNIGMCR